MQLHICKCIWSREFRKIEITDDTDAKRICLSSSFLKASVLKYFSTNSKVSVDNVPTL